MHIIVKYYQNYKQDVAKIANFSKYDFINAIHILKKRNYNIHVYKIQQ